MTTKEAIGKLERAEALVAEVRRGWPADLGPPHAGLGRAESGIDAAKSELSLEELRG